MPSLSRTDFLQEMSNKALNLERVRRDPRLSSLNWAALDLNRNGVISGSELTYLFTALDRFDVNGSFLSLDLGSDTAPTTVGKMVAAIRELATTITNPPPSTSVHLLDPALAKAFPRGITGSLGRGYSGIAVVAVQYTLGRLGYLQALCDGRFGEITEQAVLNFQTAQGLPVTGNVDAQVLKALDTAVMALDLRTPATKALDPLAYLSNFRALGLPVLTIRSTAEIFTWASPEIRHAFGQFVGFYWEVMKRNRVEGDCKNIALFFMDQFRKQLAADRLINLAHPVLRGAAEKKWIIATRDKTQGLFSRADQLLSNEGLRVARPGYGVILNVQALDSQHSMLYGVNVHYPQISANQVAKSCTRLFDWNSSYDNRGDRSKPELPVNQLAAGHLIFIDHSGDGKFDHTVTVVKVDKDSAGRTRKIIMAVGSYDDVRDASSATSVEGVGLSIVNTYSEEVTVELNELGKITSSAVTYSSEPSYLVDTRYSARTTLMEQQAGGKLIVARWG